MRIKELPKEEYEKRVEKLQSLMKKNDLDLIACYSSECESGVIRYFTGFWPFFDFASLLIPREGEPILLTGGPESADFAKVSSKIKNVDINPLLVETSAPTEWIRKAESNNFSEILKKYKFTKNIKKIGVSNYNIFPNLLFKDLIEALPAAEVYNVDDLILELQSLKSEIEIPFIEEAYKIAQQSLIKAIQSIKEGVAEYEIEAVARKEMLELGAEGTPYPAWVCSGNNTILSLCRSTDKKINKNELIQLTIGSKYMGYCGNICRPVSLGKPKDNALRLMKIGVEASNYAINKIKPGIQASDVFKGYYEILLKYNLEEFALYGPAHGTGFSEVEGLWMSENANFIIKPNMLFNVDIWLSDSTNGLRFEDGILITENGIKMLTSYKREVIILE